MVQISKGRGNFWGLPAHRKALSVTAEVYAAKNQPIELLPTVTLTFPRENSAPATQPAVKVFDRLLLSIVFLLRVLMLTKQTRSALGKISRLCPLE